MLGRRVEGGGDGGLRLAGPDHARFGPAAEREAEAVEQDRLARAGFARQRREARTKGEVQALDQHHVADGEAGEHAAAGARAKTAS